MLQFLWRLFGKREPDTPPIWVYLLVWLFGLPFRVMRWFRRQR